MNFVEILALIAIVLIVGGASAYIIKAKLSGKKCIGCPDSAACSGKCSSCSACCSCKEKQNEEI